MSLHCVSWEYPRIDWVSHTGREGSVVLSTIVSRFEGHKTIGIVGYCTIYIPIRDHNQNTVTLRLQRHVPLVPARLFLVAEPACPLPGFCRVQAGIACGGGARPEFACVRPAGSAVGSTVANGRGAARVFALFRHVFVFTVWKMEKPGYLWAGASGLDGWREVPRAVLGLPGYLDLIQAFPPIQGEFTGSFVGDSQGARQRSQGRCRDDLPVSVDIVDRDVIEFRPHWYILGAHIKNP